MKIIKPILSWLVTLLLPVSLLFLAMRLLLTPTFLYVEYSLPNFPPDDYGFTTRDRLEYAPLALEYLLNDADVSFLGDLEFPEGGELFNQRELSHMFDVKNVLKPALLVGHLVWAVVASLGIWAFFGGWWPEYVRAVRRGGWLTVGLVAVVAIAAAVSFWQFFTFFHSLFFEGDSWLFLYSDTLIRLFPMRFWQDVFLAVGLISLGSGLILGLSLRPNLEKGVM